jgi:Ca2+-binding EF-hand superfamily protein
MISERITFPRLAADEDAVPIRQQAARGPDMTTAAQDVIREKHGRAFDALDSDGDGRLETADYVALVDRFVKAYGLAAGDRHAGTLGAFFLLTWEELLRHANPGHDRTLNREQYIAAAQLVAVDTSRINVADGSGQVMFDCIDADGDEKIDREEFARYLRDVWQVKSPDAMDSFDKLDLDRDRFITRQEFLRAIHEYYFSTDPDAAGSGIFGRI